MRFVAVALIAILAGFAPARGGVSGEEVAQALRDLGYMVELEKEEGNDYPLIFLHTSKINALLIFYEENPFAEGFEAL
ncbi:hypothetical protein [Oceanithermus sp.]